MRKGKVCKVPVMIQLEAVECGSVCLAMVLAWYGRWVSLEEMREKTNVTRDGVVARNMVFAAREYGLNAQGYRFDAQDLKNGECAYPCIVYWMQRHFMVLDGFEGDTAVLNDPACGVVRVAWNEFERSYSGVCLSFGKSEAFVPGGQKPGIYKFIRRRLHDIIAPSAVAAAACLLLTFVSVLMLEAGSRIVDADAGYVKWFVLLPFLAALYVILSCLRAWYMLKVQGELDMKDSVRFIKRLLSLPIRFFAQRTVGDIAMRQTINRSIAETFVFKLASAAIDCIAALVFFAVLLWMEPLAAAAALVGAAVNFAVSMKMSEVQMQISRKQIRDMVFNAGLVLGALFNMESVKAQAAEQSIFQSWCGVASDLNDNVRRSGELKANIGAFPMVSPALAALAVFAIGAWNALHGRETPGGIVVMLGLTAGFLTPSASLIAACRSIQEMRVNLERTEDVMQYEFKETKYPSGTGSGKLSGAVEISHLTFGYSRTQPPILNDISISIKPGECVALVGGSGSGKSTLAKLIAGLYEPWSGEIRFDGRLRSEIAPIVFRDSVATVDQESALFSGSVAENIKMWDDSIEDFEMILAARDASLHDSIIQRPYGYDMKLTESGGNLSGGQRQRLDISRALAGDPTVVILDEATSALDAVTEENVTEAISFRGITRIVIAHRLSAVKDSDMIYVFEDGRIAESGTHDELMAKNGAYARLERDA